MAHTEYQNQKTDNTSWIRWINEMLDRFNNFYEEATLNLTSIAKQIIYKITTELRFFISRLTIVDFFFGGITLGIIALASFFMFTALGLVSYQVFLWIKDGIWTEFTIMVVFDFIFQNTLMAQWLTNPESWFGLQKVIEWLLINIPLSIALFIPSAFIFGVMVCISAIAIAFRFYQFKKEL